MKTEWDYTALADSYLERPSYSDTAIDAMLSITGLKKGDNVCDIGAGVAHLSLMLLSRGLKVVAIEPNDAMKIHGINRTKNFKKVSWYQSTAENTDQASNRFDMVTFGSSFNVCDRRLALEETARILKPKGWFVCMWNNRQLEDPIQAGIESLIKERITSYDYGSRRENQTAVLEESGLFGAVIHLNSLIIHEQRIEKCVEAWRSHATLARQSGNEFENIVLSIEKYLKSYNRESIQIPYSTNIWLSQLR
jgi:ubiquinone/menaquinone biosynthesis C-methylase UbiE